MRAVVALMSFLLAPLAAAQSPRVVVVKSSDLSAYSQLVAGLRAELRASVDEVVLDGPEGEKALSRALRPAPSLLVALGPQGANAARRLAPSTPLVFAMVPYYEKYSLEAPQITGVALTSDFSGELSMLKRIFPQSPRIGMLHDPRYSGALVDLAKKLAAERNQLVVPVGFESSSAALKALKDARKKVDALVLVADKTVASAAVMRTVIQFSQQEKLPLVALSPSQVKEGAMFALSPSPLGIGAQVARIANRILHEKVDPSALAVARPEGMELSLNVDTLRKVGGAGSATGLLEFAAENDYPVRVFR